MFNNNCKNKKEITKKALARHIRFNIITSILFLIILFILIIQFTYNVESTKSISYHVNNAITSNINTEHREVKQTIRSNKANKKENKKVIHTSKEKIRKATIDEYEVYETNVETTTTTTVTSHSKDTTNNTTTTANNTYFNVPIGNTSFFAYMDYNTITDTNSYQYQYQVNYCYTDDMGLRRNQYGDYVIALGSYYGTEIGTRYSITLDNGTTFTAVLGDCKADMHTDAMNQYRSAGYNSEYQNVIEFIVDSNYLSSEVKSMGNIGEYNMFNCTGIVSIAKIN